MCVSPRACLSEFNASIVQMRSATGNVNAAPACVSMCNHAVSRARSLSLSLSLALGAIRNLGCLLLLLLFYSAYVFLKICVFFHTNSRLEQQHLSLFCRQAFFFLFFSPCFGMCACAVTSGHHIFIAQIEIRRASSESQDRNYCAPCRIKAQTR